MSADMYLQDWFVGHEQELTWTPSIAKYVKWGHTAEHIHYHSASDGCGGGSGRPPVAQTHGSEPTCALGDKR
jgi:hypothetical protein